MDQIVNRPSHSFVWPTEGHPGRVPLNALVPDPDQPRKYFGDEELQELAETMKKENDGEQREILTVRALTDEENEAIYPLPARYMIVSGERRWRAAPMAGLSDIEIRVKKYKSRAYQKLDAFMLNGARVGLSDIENAEHLADLAKDFGWTTQEEISKRIGQSTSWVSQHLALLKLSPKARARMSPSIKEYLRLGRDVGVFLSKLSFEMQDGLLEGMPTGDRVTATQQVRWMREQLKDTPNEVAMPKFKPATLRSITKYFAGQIERRAKELMAIESYDRLFENASLEQAQELTGIMVDAQNELQELVRRIQERLSVKDQSIGKVKKAAAAFIQSRKVAESEVQAAPEQPKAAVSVPKAPIQPPVQVPAKMQGSPAVTRTNVGLLGKKIEPIAKVTLGAEKDLGPMLGGVLEKTVTYFSDSVSRKVTGNVTRRQYLHLFDQEKLGFQLDKTERPEWMPDKAEALTNWAQYCNK